MKSVEWIFLLEFINKPISAFSISSIVFFLFNLPRVSILSSRLLILIILLSLATSTSGPPIIFKLYFSDNLLSLNELIKKSIFLFLSNLIKLPTKILWFLFLSTVSLKSSWSTALCRTVICE